MDFFELVWMETESLTPGERQKDIAYTGILHIHLDERDNRTEDQQDLRPNGFTEPATMSDFPVRDRGMELHIRRRRWLTPDGRSVILNIYPLVAEGTQHSVAFAEFLKKTWIRPQLQHVALVSTISLTETTLSVVTRTR